MLEQIYNDFITNVLPLAQEGLMITKDYFQELFGRYIQYLIVMDSISLGLSVIAIILMTYLLKWIFTKDSDEVGAIIFCIIISIFLIRWLSGSLSDVAKDIYVPEIRVYEQIQDLNSSNNSCNN